MHRQELLTYLQAHSSHFMEETAFVRRAIDYIRQHHNVFSREQFPAHVTASTWVVSPDRSQVLMLHHKKLSKWFQPGGHADGDNDILRVALKETSEETGIDLANIRVVSQDIFDVDIHTIPEGHDPRHEHIDIRFLVEIDDRLPVPGNDESHEIRWIPLHQVKRYNNMRSVHRMVEKTRRLRPGHTA